MAYEQRDNSGTIFVNDRKETEKHPDRTGTAMIDGVMYYVSGWIKEGAKGKFMSLAFKRKDQEQPRQQSISERAMPKRPDPISSGRHPNGYSGRDMDNSSGRLPREDMNDDIPFSPEFR